jgi:hypothetical protein
MIHHIISTAIGLKIAYNILTFSTCLISFNNSMLELLETVFSAFAFVLCESYILSMFGILNLGVSFVLVNFDICLFIASAGFFIFNYVAWVALWIFPYEGCFSMVFYLFFANIFIVKQNSNIVETIEYNNPVLYYRKMCIVKSSVSVWSLYYIVSNIYFICNVILIELEYSSFSIQLGYKASQVLIILYTAFLFRPGPGRGFIDDFQVDPLNDYRIQVLQATISNESAPCREYCLVLKPDTSETIKSLFIAITSI